MMDTIGTEPDSRAEAKPSAGGSFAKVYRVLQDAIDARAFPGCAFGAMAGGRMVLSDALGSFTYEPDAPAVEPETVFDVASVTKVVATTAIAMTLFERGELQLDMPVGELLPGFVIGRANSELARRVTLRNLLAHNSGLPGYVEFFRKELTASGLFRACLALPIEAAPGERFEYSDPGFILLGKALEILNRESLSAAARKEIFEPLGMKASCYRPARPRWERIPPTEIDETFRRRRIQGEVQDENAWVLDGVAGHAGVFSNVPDLLRFAGGILDSYHGSSGIFKRETIELFSQRQTPAGSSQALGWDTPSPSGSSAGRFFSSKSIGHLGYSGCSLWIDLEAQVAAVLLTNRTWPDRKSQAIKQVRPAFHDALRESL
ncbi:serine hydrolase domain-containing protein [Occallatibacter savannae]|uniref:serine hydrolase domain-containing protein n=1 Tax=Occallatibacter savannae TaxID=1002691 RepID=UPI000D694395|nr:serine hydrolase domain-containing protein [Occallatibacter savannae]